MPGDVLARVSASGPRRAFGLAVLGALGALLVALALLAVTAAPGYRIMLAGIGASSLWLCARMWRATQLVLELTAEEVRLGDGTPLVQVAQIIAIDRGAFAFKPSQGFILKLSGPVPPRWQPGLFWCLGRRLGVGGVTRAGPTKLMAEIIETLISARAG